MRFPSVGMSAAATLSSVALVAEGQEAEDNLVSQVDGEVNGAVTTVRKIYTESIEIKFVAAVNTISLETVTPELSVEKNVFDLNAEAEITVTNLPEGSVIYYTTDDTSPDSSGSRTKIENGEITVTSPNQEDGGAVTVQVVFAAEDDANTAYSAVSELTVSFYNTTNSNEDVISLLVNEGTFYFKEIKTAFAAADDPNLNGDVTFTLLDDAVYEGVNSRVYLFTGVPGTVTLDLNGNNLTFSGTSGKNYYAYLCATRTIITDSTASGQAVSQAENKWEKGNLNSGKLILDSCGLMLNTRKSKPNTESRLTIEDVQVEYNCTGTSGIALSMAGADTGSTLHNTIFIGSGTETASSYMITGQMKAPFCAENCYIETNNSNGLSVGPANISDCYIKDTVDEKTLFSFAASTESSISDGYYEGATLLTITGKSTKLEISDGVFSGDITVTGSGSTVEIQEGYFKQDPILEPGKEQITAPACVKTVVSSGQYEGWTWYHPNENFVTGTITVDGDQGVATVSGNTEIYDSADAVYTITLLPEYVISEITLNGEEQALTPNENGYGLSTGADELTYIYKIKAPSKNFSLTFTIIPDPSKETVVASIGDDEYKILSQAMLELTDGSTLKLEADIEYNYELKFDKSNVTLDLNGHALEMDVPLQNLGSDTENYSILISNGSLTITDSTQTDTSVGSGKITFAEKDGIRIEGENTSFTMDGGTIGHKGTTAIACWASNSSVTIQNGRICGRILMWQMTSRVHFSGGRIENTYNGIYAMQGGVEISGGEIITTNASSAGVLISSGFSGENGEALKITNGTITSAGYAVHVKSSIDGNASISGGKLTSTGDSALFVETNARASVIKGILEVGGTVELNGSTNAISFYEKYDNSIPVKISGGTFICGEDYIPISNTYYCVFPDSSSSSDQPSKVLRTREYNEKNKIENVNSFELVETGDLAGVYQSQTESVGQVEYTYQDFDGLSDGSGNGLNQMLESAKTIYDAGNENNENYNTDVWEAFVAAYDEADRLIKFNRNANQDEIDYRATILANCLVELDSDTTVDVESLSGEYYIGVSLWKYGMTSQSMANNAVDHTAILKVWDNSDGTKTGRLTLNFHPIKQYGLWGSLEDFYVYQGKNYTDSRNSLNMGVDEANGVIYRKEASYDNYYTFSSTDGTQTFEGVTDSTPDSRPGTIIIDLPYLGTSDDLRKYSVGMNVDLMGGYASTTLVLSWGDLKEKNVESSLTTDISNVVLLQGETQKVTAKVNGSTDTWTFSWADDGTNVAAIDQATGDSVTVTAVSSGATEEKTCSVTVTATNGQETLTKTISVTAAGKDAKAVTATVQATSETTTLSVSGDILVTNKDDIDITSDEITLEATTTGSVIDHLEVEFEAGSIHALAQEEKSIAIESNVGTLVMDKAVAEKAANSGETVVLSIEKVDAPDIEGLTSSDFESTYDLSMSYGGSNVTSLGGRVTITVPWSAGNEAGYVYYVDGDELIDRQDLNISNGTATWTTTHFSTWALSTDPNLIDLGIKEGVYSVPIRIKQADNTSRDSMANDAVGDMVVADVDEDGVTYTMFLKARIGDEMGGGSLRGHLIKMWYYAPDDTSRSNPIRATVVRTYQDRDMNDEIDTFPREVEVYQEGDPNDYYYIQVSVDAMGGDSAIQDALVRLDWDNALDDGGEAAREGFEDEYAIEQVIDSGDSVSRSDLSDWIDNENILLVQGRDDDLTARFDTDALGDLYDQTSSSIKFVLEEVRTSKLTDEQQETAGDRPVYQLKLTSSGDDITDIGDGNVDVTLPYELDDGEVADGLVIWLLDEDGTYSKIKCSYSERGKTVSFDTTEFGVFVIGYDAEQIWENPFTDVKEDDWFYEAVKYVVQKGLFAGTSETTFEPNLAMTRGMLVTVLYRLEGTPAVTGNSTFADVAPGQYYTSAVIWATQNGIVSGYGNGYFGTNDIVSREQMATILFRYAKSKDYDTSLVKDIGGFTDSGQVASYAKRALQWAYANGIIGGTSETTISPKGSATRSQVATILMRFDEKIIVPVQEKAAKEAAEAEK